MKPLILITGASGFLGQHLLRELRDQYEIIAFTRDIKTLKPTPGVHIVENGALDSTNFLAGRSVFAALHAAVSYGTEGAVLEANVELPFRLAQCAMSAGAKRFIHFDSFFIKHAPAYAYLQEYRTSKQIGLKKLKTLAQTLSIINLQLEHLYGPGDHAQKFLPALLSDLRAHKPRIALTPGEQQRDFLYVGDLVDLVSKILNSQKAPPALTTYEVGTGTPHSIRDLVLTAHELTKSTSVLGFGDLPYREHELMFSCAQGVDLEKLRALSGWSPATKLRAGIERYIRNT